MCAFLIKANLSAREKKGWEWREGKLEMTTSKVNTVETGAQATDRPQRNRELNSIEGGGRGGVGRGGVGGGSEMKKRRRARARGGHQKSSKNLFDCQTRYRQPTQIRPLHTPIHKKKLRFFHS